MQHTTYNLIVLTRRSIRQADIYLCTIQSIMMAEEQYRDICEQIILDYPSEDNYLSKSEKRRIKKNQWTRLNSYNMLLEQQGINISQSAESQDLIIDYQDVTNQTILQWVRLRQPLAEDVFTLKYLDERLESINDHKSKELRTKHNVFVYRLWQQDFHLHLQNIFQGGNPDFDNMTDSERQLTRMTKLLPLFQNRKNCDKEQDKSIGQEIYSLADYLDLDIGYDEDDSFDDYEYFGDEETLVQARQLWRLRKALFD